MRPVHMLLVAVVVTVAGCATPDVPPTDEGQGPVDVPTLRVDADRIWADAVAQVENPAGTPLYRIPGTDGNRAVADWIAASLNASNATAHLQFFSAEYRCEGPVAMQNVVGVLPGASEETVYVAAHFDTRPIADKDPDPARRDEPVLGANDGASGVAVALELARLLGSLPERNLTYRFLFFDGEDGGQYGPNDPACGGDWALGSQHYVENMGNAELENARALILLDLVGDQDLELRKEYATYHGPGRAIQSRLWTIAGALGHADVFRNETAPWPITDDHTAFLERGVPAVDIIHIDGDQDVFPATHHTTFDDLAHLSKENMAMVGDVVLTWLLEQERGSVGT